MRNHWLKIVFVGAALAGGAELRASVLWDGLQPPSSTAESSWSLGANTLVGFEVSITHNSSLDSLEGFISRPRSPFAPLPQFTVSLWDGSGNVLAEALVPFSAVATWPSSVGTGSGLRVGKVMCDLSGLLPTLSAGEDYVVAVRMSIPGEWLIHGGVGQSSLVNTGNGWQTLPGGSGWNARLLATPMPEPVGTGLALAGLLTVGVAWRRGRKNANSTSHGNNRSISRTVASTNT